MKNKFYQRCGLLFSFALCVLASVISISAQASSLRSANHSSLIYFGVGVFDHDVGRLTSSASGSTSLTSSLYFNFALTAEFKISSQLSLSPYLAYSAFGSKSADSNEKSTVMPIALRLEEDFGQFELHAGPGILIYKISGQGGTATLSNGTGTAVFGLPSGSRSNQLVLLNFGAGQEISGIKAAIDAFVTGLASSRRALSLALTFSIGLI